MPAALRLPAVSAVVARQIGSFLLTETMERRPGIGLRSYDRLFPNQDTLPKGGFGNLIALPLQGRAREQGNSVFVDERLGILIGSILAGILGYLVLRGLPQRRDHMF